MQYSFQQGLLNMPPKRDPDRRLLLLPTEQIRTVPNRLRKSTDRAALSELMISIAQIGLIEPIVVRRQQEGYEQTYKDTPEFCKSVSVQTIKEKGY